MNVSKRTASITAIVVVAVIALGFVAQRVATKRAKYAKTLAEIAEVQEALRRYYLDNGTYPTSDAGPAAIAGYFGSGPDERMIVPRPARSPALRDAWGREYFYQSDGNSYLESFGASGSPTGTRDSPVIIVRSPSTPPD